MFGTLLSHGVSVLDEVSVMCGVEFLIWFDSAFWNIWFVRSYDCVLEDFVGCVYVIGRLHVVKGVINFCSKVAPVCFPVASWCSILIVVVCRK